MHAGKQVCNHYNDDDDTHSPPHTRILATVFAHGFRQDITSRAKSSEVQWRVQCFLYEWLFHYTHASSIAFVVVAQFAVLQTPKYSNMTYWWHDRLEVTQVRRNSKGQCWIAFKCNVKSNKVYVYIRNNGKRKRVKEKK